LNHNPLLDMTGLPPFSKIKPEHVEPAIDHLLATGRRQVQALLDQTGTPTWDNLIQPLTELEDRLNRVWSPVGHLNSVLNGEELRQAYTACLPKLSEYATELGQNERLFAAYKVLVDGSEPLDRAQRKVLENALRDFHLSGVDLPAEKKVRFKAVSQQLSQLSSKFEENLLDATNAWSKLVTDKTELAGLPESVLGLMSQFAEQRDKQGWILTLDFPSYMPVMHYADSAELRQEMYTAYMTRASDQGPDAGKWDNSGVMEQILGLRHELAELLGFDNYTQLSLATKMARSSEEVMVFLHDLARHSVPQARRELAEVAAFALDCHGVAKLEAWDINYYSEKLRQQRYAFTQEELRPYFPESKVVPGLFAVVERLFAIKIRAITTVDLWHPDVQFFEIRDSRDELCGQFYLDLYARSNKRGGAWMSDCINRCFDAGCKQLPVAFLTCNFSPPVAGKPVLFTHNEVETLFHEFGHGLHHMLTRIDYPAVAGISGVAWDAVELPSQFLENWCWQREALELISGHYESGETLPDELYAKMQAAKNYQSAMQMVRQLEFALFDFSIHLDYDPALGGQIYPTLERVRDEVAVHKPPAFNRFAHGFAHIFAGGYGAGYYSYKWAEVLSADAFSLFEEQGIFDRASGEAFLQQILARGGSQDAMELFVAFRGREPKIDALLRHSGVSS